MVRKEKDAGYAKQHSRGWTKWDSRELVEPYPTGWGSCCSPGWFPWEGFALLNKNSCCYIRGWTSTGIPAATLPHLFPISLTPDSLQATSVCITTPSLNISWMAANEKPVLCPQKVTIALSPPGSPLPSRQKPHCLSLLHATWAANCSSGTLCLGAQSGVQASLLSGKAPIATLSLCNLGLPTAGVGPPFSWPCPSYHSQGSFYPSLDKSHLFKWPSAENSR